MSPLFGLNIYFVQILCRQCTNSWLRLSLRDRNDGDLRDYEKHEEHDKYEDEQFKESNCEKCNEGYTHECPLDTDEKAKDMEENTQTKSKKKSNENISNEKTPEEVNEDNDNDKSKEEFSH